jgi:nitronate monooxygenase
MFRLPKIIQGPLAGFNTPLLVAAVSNNGALGSYGLGYLSPTAVEKTIFDIKKLTSEPFNLNLFVSDPETNFKEIAKKTFNPVLGKYYEALGLSLSTIEDVPSFRDQFEAVFKAKPAVVSFTFGIPPEDMIERCKKAGITVIGTATHLEEARLLEQAGMDYICAQGYEAGGHRGTFKSREREKIGTLVLTRLLARELKVPVIAAGGIMDKHGIDAAIALGASCVQMGTAFLTCSECGTPKCHVDMLLKRDHYTQVTNVFSGREARGIQNEFMEEMKDEKIAPYPVQHYFTSPIRKAAAQQGKPEWLHLWAGQGYYMCKQQTVAELLHSLEQ